MENIINKPIITRSAVRSRIFDFVNKLGKDSLITFSIFFFLPYISFSQDSLSTQLLKHKSFYAIWDISMNGLDNLDKGVGVNLKKSIGVNLDIMHPFITNGHFLVASGLGFVMAGFDIKGFAAHDKNNQIIISPSNTEYKSSQLVLGFLEIPLEFGYNIIKDKTKNNFGINIGAIGGLRIFDNYQIMTISGDKLVSLNELSKWRVRLSGRLSYIRPEKPQVKTELKSVFLSASYGLSSMFKGANETKIYPYFFGIGCTFNLN